MKRLLSFSRETLGFKVKSIFFKFLKLRIFRIKTKYDLHMLEQVDTALAGPFVNYQATPAQMRRRETTIEQLGCSNPKHLNSFFWSNFFCTALAV